MTLFRSMWVLSMAIAFVVGFYGGIHAIVYLGLGAALGAIMWACHLYDLHRKGDLR